MRRIFLKQNGLTGSVPTGYKAFGINNGDASLLEYNSINKVDTYLLSVTFSNGNLVFNSIGDGFSGTVSLSSINDTLLNTGVIIGFTYSQIYNSYSSPATASIVGDLTGAKIGVVQKIYHQNTITAPTFSNDWVRLGSGVYSTSSVNIIYAEWCGETRVEYWVVQ